MGKIIVCNMMSLDGYYEGPDHNVMVLPLDAAFDAYNLARLRAAEKLLLGRTTFEAFKGFWPGMVDHPQATPVHREIARLDNELEKVVISDTLTAEQTAPWTNTRIIRRTNAASELADLKREISGEMLVFGSHMMWNDLLAAGLIDELHLMIGGVILGSGTPLFTGKHDVALRPLDAPRSFDGSSNVLVRYATSS